MAKVIFFASVREAMGVDDLEAPLASPVSVKDLMRQVAEMAGKDSRILLSEGLLFAVNREMRDAAHMVNDGDEVAVLPPLSGGV